MLNLSNYFSKQQPEHPYHNLIVLLGSVDAATELVNNFFIEFNRFINDESIDHSKPDFTLLRTVAFLSRKVRFRDLLVGYEQFYKHNTVMEPSRFDYEYRCFVDAFICR